MKHIKQPKGTYYCGHCAMAMVLDTDMNAIISNMGANPDGSSNILMYYNYLKQLGIAYDAVEMPDNRKHIDLSGRGIISVKKPHSNRWGHAMAFKDGVIYDPDPLTETGLYEGVAAMKQAYKNWNGWKVQVYSVIKIEEEVK